MSRTSFCRYKSRYKYSPRDPRLKELNMSSILPIVLFIIALMVLNYSKNGRID